MCRMKLAQDRMVQLVTADFKVPLRAVECVRGIVEEPVDRFDRRNRAVHDGD